MCIAGYFLKFSFKFEKVYIRVIGLHRPDEKCSNGKQQSISMMEDKNQISQNWPG